MTKNCCTACYATARRLYAPGDKPVSLPIGLSLGPFKAAWAARLAEINLAKRVEAARVEAARVEAARVEAEVGLCNFSFMMTLLAYLELTSYLLA